MSPADRGVLLYYKYVSLNSIEREAVRQWFLENGTGLGMCGRVRVAFDGVNVTVGYCLV